MNREDDNLDNTPTLSKTSLSSSETVAKSLDKANWDEVRNFIDFLAVNNGYVKLARAISWLKGQEISPGDVISVGLSKRLFVSLHEDDECTLILSFKGWEYSRKQPSEDFQIPWLE
jgi:hypothetical protein